MEIELEPEQPEPVARAVAELLEFASEQRDPWWEAGNQEALGT